MVTACIGSPVRRSVALFKGLNGDFRHRAETWRDAQTGIFR